MALKLITPPDSEPVTLDEVKKQCRVTATDEDDRLEAMIPVARDALERYTGRALAYQVWELVLDAFPSGVEPIILRRSPVITVSYISYIDTDGDQQVWSNNEYQIDSETEPAEIVPAYGYWYPSTRIQKNAVRVRFTAGYSYNDSPETIALPDALRHAWLLKVQELYDGTDLTGAIRALIDPYKVWGS